MSLYSSQVQSTEPTEVEQVVRFAGGATAVSKLRGRGIIITYVSVGRVDLSWTDSQGTFIGLVGATFEATAPAGVAGYSVVAGDYDPTTRKLPLSIFSGSNALVDLTAAQRLSIRPAFVTYNLPVT